MARLDHRRGSEAARAALRLLPCARSSTRLETRPSTSWAGDLTYASQHEWICGAKRFSKGQGGPCTYVVRLKTRLGGDIYDIFACGREHRHPNTLVEQTRSPTPPVCARFAGRSGVAADVIVGGALRGRAWWPHINQESERNERKQEKNERRTTALELRQSCDEPEIAFSLQK